MKTFAKICLSICLFSAPILGFAQSSLLNSLFNPQTTTNQCPTTDSGFCACIITQCKLFAPSPNYCRPDRIKANSKNNVTTFCKMQVRDGDPQKLQDCIDDITYYDAHC